MEYVLRCKCGCVFSSKGTFDSDTNALEIDDAECPECNSDEAEIIDEVSNEPSI